MLLLPRSLGSLRDLIVVEQVNLLTLVQALHELKQAHAVTSVHVGLSFFVVVCLGDVDLVTVVKVYAHAEHCDVLRQAALRCRVVVEAVRAA